MKKLNIIADAGGIRGALDRSDLLVNATPVGMEESDPSPVPKECLRSGLYVYDLIYNRPCTRLMQDAREVKARAISGLSMLLYQGAAAFEIWTGQMPPIAVMGRALKEAIDKKGRRP